ncbi:MAG: ATP-dependent sacrificial sulfur transferase LarE [Deltaproteobacteria bacterium]|nr:ATP-dependent sacrificial sulfur transferase LarE [Deltaproteobacteria bacterium]
MEKLKSLEKRLTELSSFALAFSGGTDSTLLLALAKKIKPEKFIAITVASQFVSELEIDFAKKIACSIGVQHICLDVDILKSENIVCNTLERCYFCKQQIFSMIRDAAKEHGIDTLVHGANLDDLNDFRPGLKAAEELGFISPLVDAGFSKKMVRIFSKQIGLETWNKPSQSCFATRIAYNEKITLEKLGMVEESENYLRDLGFDHIRVRCHGKTARIEVAPEQIERLLDNNIRKKISHQFLKSGFENTSIDLDGYKIDESFKTKPLL